MVALRPEMVSF